MRISAVPERRSLHRLCELFPLHLPGGLLWVAVRDEHQRVFLESVSQRWYVYRSTERILLFVCVRILWHPMQHGYQRMLFDSVS